MELVGVAFEKRISLLVPARNLPCSRLRVVGVGGVGDECVCECVVEKEKVGESELDEAK